jgi:hypothetical protein
MFKWTKICRAKKKGGLGIKNLRKMNLSLLCKWWWVLESGDGLWQEIIHKKYIRWGPLCLVQNKLTDSPVWSDSLKIRHIYLAGRSYRIKDGRLISFWLDVWLDENPLCLQYPILFDLCVNKNCSVYDIAQANWVV